MATPAQIEANRLNAKKSTGPRTPQGKAVSSMNALKHGLRANPAPLPHEDPELAAARARAWFDYYHPQGPAAIHFTIVVMIKTLSRLKVTRGHFAAPMPAPTADFERGSGLNR